MTSATDTPRPIDCRQDRPFRNLNEVHRAGADGLNAIFLPGTLWEVGPFTHDRLPEVVRVVARGPRGGRVRPLTSNPCGNAAYTSGVNYSRQPDASEASGKPCWFIESQLVWTPYDHREVGEVGGRPPATLAPLTPQVAAATGLAYCELTRWTHVGQCGCRSATVAEGTIRNLREEVESLQQVIRNQADTITRQSQRITRARQALR